MDREALLGLPCCLPHRAESGDGGDHRWASCVNGLDDLRVVDPLEINRCDPEMGMSELPLDDDQRDAFVRHLNRVGVSELVWCEPTPDPGCGGGAGELSARG